LPGDRAGDDTPITVPMSSTAYLFSAGHRIRLQVSGGAHPRYARNTGTAEPLATAARLVPADIQILHDADAPCTLSLPVADTHARPEPPAHPLTRQGAQRPPGSPGLHEPAA
jgi:predicted acyl esterase